MKFVLLFFPPSIPNVSCEHASPHKRSFSFGFMVICRTHPSRYQRILCPLLWIFITTQESPSICSDHRALRLHRRQGRRRGRGDRDEHHDPLRVQPDCHPDQAQEGLQNQYALSCYSCVKLMRARFFWRQPTPVYLFAGILCVARRPGWVALVFVSVFYPPSLHTLSESGFLSPK